MAYSTRSISRGDVVEMKLRFVNEEGREGGGCHVHKVVEGDLKKIGEIKYSDQSDRRWIIDVVKFHSNVEIME